MKKPVLVVVLLMIACVIAGLYGAIHNQISYTVSPEYFTKFKFHQFRIPLNIPHRIGAAMVGWGAAWWMGVIISAFLIPVGIKIPRSANCFKAMIRAYSVVAFTALIVGLGALAISFLVIQPGMIEIGSRYGNEIVDDAAFARAGTMHNFSYLGGLVGIYTGWRSIRKSGKRFDSNDAIESA